MRIFIALENLRDIFNIIQPYISVKIILTEIIQPIQIIMNSSQNTTINNLSRKFRLCVCVCVCVGWGGMCGFQNVLYT